VEAELSTALTSPMALPAPSQGIRHPRLVIALVLPFLVVQLTWAGQLPAPAVYLHRPRLAPLQLSGLTYRLAADQSTVHVTLQVRNTEGSRQSGRVWWLLAAPGEGSPWSRRAYQSALSQVDLKAKKAVTLVWEEQVQLPLGSYELSAWSHVKQDTGFAHSDAELATSGSLHIRPRSPDVLRRGPSRGGVAILGGRVAVASKTPGVVQGEVRLENQTGQVQKGRLRWTLAPMGDGVSADWWRLGPSLLTGEEDVNVPSRSSSLAPFKQSLRPPPGRYALRVTLALGSSPMAGVDAFEWPDDELFVLAPPVTVPAVSNVTAKSGRPGPR